MQSPATRFPGRTIALVFLLLMFLYVIMVLLWSVTHRCEPATAFWLRPPWPLFLSFAFAFLLLLHWTVFAWAAALLFGTTRRSDHAIFAFILFGMAMVTRSLVGLWGYIEHEQRYLAGLRFGPIAADVQPGQWLSWWESAFLGWERCNCEPTLGYERYEPAFTAWPSNGHRDDIATWDLH